jgi:hypothetical protein
VAFGAISIALLIATRGRLGYNPAAAARP